MKKFLLSALLLGAGVAAASAQTFDFYISTELDGEEQPTNFKLVKDGDVFQTKMNLEETSWSTTAKFEAYVKATNKTDQPITLTIGYSSTKDVNNIASLEGAAFYGLTTCLASCYMTNPFQEVLDANASTNPGPFSHFAAEISLANAEQAKQLSFDLQTDWTITCGTESLKFKILYQTDDAIAGVDAIENTDAPAEYYNLQGIMVNNPVKGQVYIKRQAGKSSKVVF